MRILAIEDSRRSLVPLAAALNRLGHAVIAAATPEESVQFFQQEKPDLIIIDLTMQGVDGLAFAKKIREVDHDFWIPIFFIVDSQDNNIINEITSAGGDDYLLKPLSDLSLTLKINMVQRILDLQKKHQEIRRELDVLSSSDALLGIDNRVQFDKIIREKAAYANRYNITIALLLLDLDNFSQINNTLGHLMGDLLLKEVVKRIKSCVRDSDLLARIEGNAFAIILSKINHKKEASLVAKKLIEKINQVFYINKEEVRTSCSIGIACFPTIGSSPDNLLEYADLAMKYAKDAGGNGIQLYDQKFYELQNKSVDLEKELLKAVENRELFMTFHPILELQSTKLTGMKVLLRWKHPSLGLILPDVFIPLAEKMGMVTQIGSWVLKTACAQVNQWNRAFNTHFNLMFQLSLNQLLDKNFLGVINEVLDGTNIPVESLRFEMSETMIINTSIDANPVVSMIASRGIGIILDEFSAGYSSLARLKNIPISGLKIGKLFMHDVEKNSANTAQVKSIMGLCKTLNLDLIAEGIETQEQLDFFVENRCQQGLGFYFSKPLRAEEMTLYIHKKGYQLTKKPV